ncbi:OmpA family protein [Muricoccus pecuniae]|uniref:Outer membrane protein OmpA-like peptidoglycan-associated protein n=1 Tax=Muricoccus pecuniae TaxID=693023 RepID=A0A840YGE2_9PROT|nr:OmpA family protein [Roseomonas pecuniae]MBB5693562.1 outer membrane protein OmpA-like peptidoglycan-associated protein [Roseomonas pecuniae]
MPRLRAALLATTLLALPLAAQAQPVTGLYISGGAGYNYLQGTERELTGNAGAAARAAGIPTKVEVTWENGWVGLGSIGWGFGNGLRAEVEGFYRENDYHGTLAAGLASRTNGGKLWQAGAMANVLFDLDLRRFGWAEPIFTPYIGGGIGWSHVAQDNVRTDFRPVRSQLLVSDDDSDVFAFQGIAGASFPLGVPGLSLTAEYRFFGTTDPNFTVVQRQTINNTVTVTKQGLENFNHSALLGLRYAFNQPRPAPVATVAPAAPAAAPAPARTYLVFFDFDRADLTDRARQIIGEAAQAVNSTGTTRIEVAGHADRSGTPQYNQRLSQRRAEAVAAELARRGISRNQISVQAFGESRPLVPTADGVREPQNRRVEIVLR